MGDQNVHVQLRAVNLNIRPPNIYLPRFGDMAKLEECPQVPWSAEERSHTLNRRIKFWMFLEYEFPVCFLRVWLPHNRAASNTVHQRAKDLFSYTLPKDKILDFF